MTTENRKLMQMAKDSLNGNWILAVGTFLVYMLIVSGSSPLYLVLAGPFSLGLAGFTLTLARKEEARVEQIFHGFQYFGNAVIAYLLMFFYVFLWSLLLIIPGIIAAISYSMTFFIMADDASIRPQQALEKSKMMMNGYKWKFFCLGLRFIGWIILCMFTFGIGYLWLIPYMQVSYAKFYEDLKANVQA
ncbi:MAG: DUF975 family protein [Paludibacter sp.]|nr:DUF975 family protein [Paludibacter sp.]